MSILNQNIPVVIAFTPNYFVPACVTLKSILDNSSDLDKYKVYCLLTEELASQYKELLCVLGGSRMEFAYINMTGKLEGIYIDERYTIAASFRLVLAELLPHIDRVIYLDCDIIVRQNLAVLYNSIELGDNYMAVIFESPLAHQFSYIEKLGLKWNEYFNSGFLVMNLKQLRVDNMSEQFIEASKEEGLQFPDQDVLNKLCKGKTVGLSPKYNGIRTFLLPQFKDEFLKLYSLKDWVDVQRYSNIHYTGGKPWDIMAVKFEYWWKYFDRLPREIKMGFPIKKSLYFLSCIKRNALGKWVINAGSNLLRWIKY
ncbi:glycosyltransferase family 8 protein [Sphingobacterium bovistauri]|uniref:Glycosyltransferase family 8 protein n=1 Tax=Sphingobacterium bovistauri TaxID=2781959 RepID=A0ABS7Z1R7_9SPHI|nr:glycosyltransferase family 8 protein [Sphingobacterium bovistauri]MCA5004118.1 glycosyltransferase family 8 protein [Sphingobacterium bovistauri]